MLTVSRCRLSGLVSFFFHAFDAFFHFLAGLESDDKLFRNVNALTGPRISSFSCGSFFDFEDPEVAEFDSPVSDERLHDGVERLLDDLLGFELSQSDVVGDGFDDFFFCHDSHSPTLTPFG